MPGLSYPFQPRCDIDAVAHQVAVALLDDVAEVDANMEFDAAVGRDAGVTLDHCVLNLYCATHGVDNAAKLDESPVAGALHHPPVVHGDGGVDQIATQRAQPGKRTILVRACQPAEANHIGGADRGELSFFGHWSLGRRAA